MSNNAPVPLNDQQPRDPHLAVNLRAAAVMLNVGEKTVRREISRGKLKALKIGRLLRIRIAEIHAYLKRNEC